MAGDLSETASALARSHKTNRPQSELESPKGHLMLLTL